MTEEFPMASADKTGSPESQTRPLLSEAKSKLKDVALETGATLRHEAEGRAEAVKDSLAERGDTLADTLYDVAARQEGTFQGRVLDTLADSVADLADSLRHRSLASLADDTKDFARKNPGAFVAVAAVVGFAAIRFARSGTPLRESKGTSAGSGSGVPS